ncbi:hypothetical protein ABR737_33480 [Streptomyces sp. Edi2]|uniref:hypothetical protein n=1 Tax=Streptomyces sp. Edi2 TaxID=3162528 RepID=UPI003305A1C3
MRVRIVAALGLTAAALLALPACSGNSTGAKPATPSSARSGKPAHAGHDAPLSSAALKTRLLDESDLGSGYARTPKRPTQHDDVSVLGCPALNALGGDAAMGGSLNFSHKAKATFTYTASSNSEISEELYSDTAGKLSTGTGRIFDAMTGCPQYQVLVGSTKADVTTQKMIAPQLGDERWSQLLTFSSDGRDTVVKQTAIRNGGVLVIVSGSPALVDQHLDEALAKAAATR